MACPYFFPVERFAEKMWSKPPRLPLGDPYLGICCVDPLREWRPDEATLREFCNQGNARGKCSRFPTGAGPDAVRFAVTGDREGTVTISYVVEKDRAPSEHGTLEYSTDGAGFQPNNASGLLERQAQAYAESYMRRKLDPENQARNPSRR